MPPVSGKGRDWAPELQSRGLCPCPLFKGWCGSVAAVGLSWGFIKTDESGKGKRETGQEGGFMSRLGLRSLLIRCFPQTLQSDSFEPCPVAKENCFSFLLASPYFEGECKLLEAKLGY